MKRRMFRFENLQGSRKGKYFRFIIRYFPFMQIVSYMYMYKKDISNDFKMKWNTKSNRSFKSFLEIEIMVIEITIVFKI